LLRLADEGGWPGSAAAAFAVARLGRRGLLGSDQVPALCAVAARRRSPHLRANLVVALASLGARCDDPEASIQPRSWLRRAHAPVVRGATARWVAAVGETDAEGVLAGCVDEALAPDVRAACADPRLPPLDGDVDVYVYAVDGRTLLRDTVIALRLADGTSYVVRSDANAQVRLEGAPRGPLGLDDPLASPLEP
ncbi:MAG: hypothetical protein CMN30_29085, partial [Sandaracinus sp.]|nr:hypothetical protein [Sandaracinus sp.]